MKIAGARVGKVDEIHLTRDRKARVEMKIDEGFAPFREDAECTVRPQSLIGEKFVQCTPGTPRAPELRRRGNEAPLLPVERTHSPVDLDLIFAALRRPVRERLTIVVSELGSGLAGRPRELNAAIRRAAPALQRTARALAILGEDRATLGRLIDDADRVLAELAGRRREVTGFIDRADRVAQAVARRRGELDLAMRRLPPLLAELEPSAVELAGLAREGRPVLRDLRAASAPLRTLLGDLAPLTEAARPTLVDLRELARTGRRTIRSTLPVARRLRPVARRLGPVLELARSLVESMRAKGAVEGLQQFVYFGSAATARFDRFSHILPSYQISGPCQQRTEEQVPGCSAHWREGPVAGTQGVGDPAARRKRRGARRGAVAPVRERELLDYLLSP